MSKTKLITLLVVAAISLALGAVVLKQELAAPTAAALIHRKIVRAADAISVKNSAGEFTLFRNGEGGECSEYFECPNPWFIQGFDGIPLSGDRVQQTLEALATARVIQTVVGGSDLSLFGLEPPELQVTLRGVGFRERTIFIGKRSEYLGGRYALSVDGKTVLLVEDSVVALVGIKQHEYFALSPQVFNPEEIESFTVSSSREKFQVYRRETEWKVDYSPDYPAVPASSHNVELFLRGLSAVSAGRLVPLSSEEGKALSSQLDVKLALAHQGSEVPQLISFGLSNSMKLAGVRLPENQVVFHPDTSRAIYFAPVQDIVALFQGSTGFRKRLILSFDVRDFERAILYSRDEGVFEVARSESEWTVNGKPGDGPFVKELFRELSEVECGGFIPHEVEGGTDEMSARIWLRGRQEPIEAYFISLGEGMGGYFVKGGQDIRGCFVDFKVLRKIRPRAEILYRKEIKKRSAIMDTLEGLNR
jgi:hypothetical protein